MGAILALEPWLAFVIASAIVLVIPGPTVLTVIGYSAAQGRRATVPLVAAVALGDCTSLAFSLLAARRVGAVRAPGGLSPRIPDPPLTRGSPT